MVLLQEMRYPFVLMMVFFGITITCFCAESIELLGKEQKSADARFLNSPEKKQFGDPDSIENSVANESFGFGSDEVYLWTVFGIFICVALCVVCAPSK